MLILTRKIGETIRIADDVKVVVVGVKRGEARLAISAPKSVSINREEINQRTKSGDRAAEFSSSSFSDS